MRDITIRTVLNGWVVTVGCQTVVFSSLGTLMQELGSYLVDPEATEKRYAALPNAKFVYGATAAAVPRNYAEPERDEAPGPASSAYVLTAADGPVRLGGTVTGQGQAEVGSTRGRLTQ